MREDANSNVGEPAPPAGATPRLWVVAVGASAGGLEAFERFFRSVEPGCGFAFVVVQHLSPEHESILPQLLAAYTKMPVAPVADATAPLPDHVYVIPPNATLPFRDGRLRLNALEPRASRQPISRSSSTTSSASWRPSPRRLPRGPDAKAPPSARAAGGGLIRDQ